LRRRTSSTTPSILLSTPKIVTTRTCLAEAVDAALPLVVAGGVPRKVVVDDGVEVGLEVDALAQAVGADEHPLGMLGQVLDPVLPVTAATSTPLRAARRWAAT